MKYFGILLLLSLFIHPMAIFLILGVWVMITVISFTVQIMNKIHQYEIRQIKQNRRDHNNY